MTSKTKQFFYSPNRDIIKLIAKLLWLVVLFFIWKALVPWLVNLAEKYDGLPKDYANRSITIYMLFYIIIVVFYILLKSYKIYTSTYRVLIINKDEIVYYSGWITESRINIPISKIQSCDFRRSLLQKFYGTMDIHITTAGDNHDICFYDVKKGYKAYVLLCNLSKGDTSAFIDSYEHDY